MGSSNSTTVSSSGYNKTPVHSATTSTGFHHNYYIMYHATDPRSVESILNNGFKLSDSGGNMLGEGIYCSRNIDKAYPNYGEVVFRLLVYAGKVYKCTRQDDPNRKSWHATHASAWVPPGSVKLNPAGLEENCVRDANMIRILGIAEGYGKLSKSAKLNTTNCEDFSTTGLHNANERGVLQRMIQERSR